MSEDIPNCRKKQMELREMVKGIQFDFSQEDWDQIIDRLRVVMEHSRYPFHDTAMEFVKDWQLIPSHRLWEV